MLGGGYKEPPKFLERQEIKHTSGDGSDIRDNFYSVAFSDDGSKLFGRASHDLPVDNQGAVYEFKQINGSWTQTAIITSSAQAGEPADILGENVSTCGDYLFASARADNTNGAGAGAVFVFHSGSNGWQEVQTLTVEDPDGSPQGDQFGFDLSVSADGRVLAAAAKWDNEGWGQNYGSFYIFVSGAAGYEQVQKITLNHPILYELIGSSVAISADGSKIVVGADNATWPSSVSSAYMTSSTGPNTGGIALVYESGSAGWEQVQLLTAPNATAGDRFGCSIQMDPQGETLMVSANNADTNGSTNNGAVYVFKANESGLFENYQTLAPNLLNNLQLGGRNPYCTALVRKDTGASQQLIACIGSQLEDNKKGSVYVMKDDGEGFSLYQKFSATYTNGQFGSSVVASPDGKWMAVGSFLDSTAGSYQNGTITMYEWSDEY